MTGDTAAPADSQVLRRRIVSAAVLASVALAAVLYVPAWDVLVGVIGVAAAWEWSRLCNKQRMTLSGLILMLTIALAISLASLGNWLVCILAVIIGGASSVALSDAGRSGALWAGIGVVYVIPPCLALVWLRDQPDHGLATTIWLLVLVWATDSAAYFAGRAIGGPKLAPAISPKKTWAGLAGGVIGAALVGVVAVVIYEAAWWVVPISAVLAVLEQVGDLWESAVKRRFGVKDAGRIIPGHGGVLDRVDGLMAVVVAVAALQAIAGASPLSW